MDKKPASPAYRRSIFDGIFPKFYDFTANLFTLWQVRRVRREAINALGIKPGQKAIDIACGTGEMALLLAEKVGSGGSVIAIDLSQRMIDVAQKKSRSLPQLAFSRRDFVRLNHRNSFDAATIGLAAHEVPDDIRLKMYREAYRALKKGGKFLVFDFQWPKNILLKPFFWLFMVIFEPNGFSYAGEDHKKILESISFKRIYYKDSLFLETSVYQKP